MDIMQVGDTVQVVDTFNGGPATAPVVCTAVIVRVTKTLYVTRNQHGNAGKYRRADNRMVGYAWPQLTHAIRKA